MSVFPQFFLAFMGGDFSKFALSSAGHLILLGYCIWRHKPPFVNYAIIAKKGQPFIYPFSTRYFLLSARLSNGSTRKSASCSITA